MATEGELFELKLSQLSHHLRCAAAATCAKRIITVYNNFTDTELQEASDATLLALNYAVHDAVDLDVVNEKHEILLAKSKRVGQQNGEDLSPLYYATIALDQVLKSITDKGINSAKYALYFSIDAVQFSAIDDPDEAAEEEEAFQKAVLERALSWSDKPVAIDMFDDLSSVQPHWELALLE